MIRTRKASPMKIAGSFIKCNALCKFLLKYTALVIERDNEILNFKYYPNKRAAVPKTKRPPVVIGLTVDAFNCSLKKK